MVVRVEPLIERAKALDGYCARVESSPSVADLVRSSSSGDRDAWRQLLARFGGMIEAIGRRHGLSPEEIDHLVQTTWLRLVESFDRIDDPARIGGWLAATARRECQEMLKHLAS